MRVAGCQPPELKGDNNLSPVDTTLRLHPAARAYDEWQFRLNSERYRSTRQNGLETLLRLCMLIVIKTGRK